jgi:hypothetical protein
MPRSQICCVYILCLFLSSCTNYYFSEPQPVNSTNSYTIPKKFRGSWNISDNDQTESIDSLIIGKYFYKQIKRLATKESKSELNKDSTVYFIDNKLYYYENSKLKGGYTYHVLGDSVVVDVVDSEIIEFGEKAFLRKFDYGYILNLKHEEMDNWWEICFIDIRTKDRLLIRKLTDKDIESDKEHQILH